jgi:hypothetical protein
MINWEVIAEETLDALEEMVWQYCSRDGVLTHSFMSAEEFAFEVLEKYGRIEIVNGQPEMVSQRLNK